MYYDEAKSFENTHRSTPFTSQLRTGFFTGKRASSAARPSPSSELGSGFESHFKIQRPHSACRDVPKDTPLFSAKYFAQAPIIQRVQNFSNENRAQSQSNNISPLQIAVEKEVYEEISQSGINGNYESLLNLSTEYDNFPGFSLREKSPPKSPRQVEDEQELRNFQNIISLRGKSASASGRIHAHEHQTIETSDQFQSQSFEYGPQNGLMDSSTPSTQSPDSYFNRSHSFGSNTIAPLQFDIGDTSMNSSNYSNNCGEVRERAYLPRRSYNLIQLKLMKQAFISQNLSGSHFDDDSSFQLFFNAFSDINHYHEATPESPLDESFPPVAPYLAGGFVNHNCRRSVGDHCLNPRYRVLRACDQVSAIPIHLVFDNMRDIYKVNEGVYGEVFSGRFKNSQISSVFKLVPIEGSEKVNGEKQKKYLEILPEIIISQRLNLMRNPAKSNRYFTTGFCRMFRSRMLEGPYPHSLIYAWDKWDRKYKSDNDRPRFGPHQTYVAFEYEFGGVDLENFSFKNAGQTYAILLQIVFSLAVGEGAIEFEHRDLHWGNILITRTPEPSIPFRLNGIDYRLPSAGLQSTLIDFTISRCSDNTREPVYADLKDDDGQFGGGQEYQYEIYRMMRRQNRNQWENFCPKSNIFWMHYLADKLIDEVKYTEPYSETHAENMAHLVHFEKNVLFFNSCQDLVLRNCQIFKKNN